jgi:hypothetical protein
MSRFSGAVNKVVEELYRQAESFLGKGDKMVVKSNLLYQNKQKRLDNYTTKVASQKAGDTDSFLHIIQKAEKQEGYTLDSDEFNGLLAKIKLAERDTLNKTELFIRVDDYILRQKANHMNKLRKRSEGVRA